ncbi:hypothetical protein CR513_24267, partial [Mucuna pruriens]
MVNFELVNMGKSTNIMYCDLFEKLQIPKKDLFLHPKELIKFTRDQIKPFRHIGLLVTFEEALLAKTIKVQFLVVHFLFAYNVILERTTINTLGVIASIVHLAIKYTYQGAIFTIEGVKPLSRANADEANLDKYRVIMEMRRLQIVKEIQQLNKRMK